MKYAELRGVQQIENEEVASIRAMLGVEFENQVLANERWKLVFGIAVRARCRLPISFNLQ